MSSLGGKTRVYAQVLQRGLPRPKTLESLPAVRSEAALQGVGLKETAEALLQNEVVMLLQHDAAKYPIKVPVITALIELLGCFQNLLLVVIDQPSMGWYSSTVTVVPAAPHYSQ